jgi:hypothetical protein
MNDGSKRRWFHTLVVTGASLTACGGVEQEAVVVRPKDAAPAADVSSDTNAGVDASVPDDAGVVEADTTGPEDARSDFRCCIITR